MTHEPSQQVTLPDDCTPASEWHPWSDDAAVDSRKFRVISGKSFGTNDSVQVHVDALQFDDGTVEYASISIASRFHDRSPGAIDAAGATRIAANLLSAADELDRLNGWTSE